LIRRKKSIVVLGASALCLGILAMSGPAVGAHLPVRATAYIRADAGLPTFNPDVDPTSNCATPDYDDIQALSAPTTVGNNVHIDACIFGSGAAPGATVSDVDVPATFELLGVGTFSACPDPDGAGPKTALREDHDGDGNFEHCHLSGYQSTGTGALEYHARVNNTTQPGQSRVLLCYDPNRDGCFDEDVLSQVAIGWVPRSS